MAAIPVDAPRALDAHRPLSKTSLAVAGSSTVIEWYDFYIYGLAAALVFGGEMSEFTRRLILMILAVAVMVSGCVELATQSAITYEIEGRGRAGHRRRASRNAKRK